MSMPSPEACLPPDLRGPAATITRIPVGQSGADVYRVEASGQAYVLKIAGADQPLEMWRRKVHVVQLAAGADLAPRIVHVDEAHRAIVSVFVADRSFPAFYADPRTRGAAIAALGRTVRRLHDLALPPDADARDARAFLATTVDAARSHALPSFVGDAIARVLAADEPARDRAAVFSHNDLNPSNLVYDGEHIVLLDWEVAGPNDPYYDLATLAMFLRMDEPTCLQLLAVYDGAPVSTLPARFVYNRRLVALLCGMLFVGLAGGTGDDTLESTPSLAEAYQRMRAGSLNIATANGRRLFGLALIKESLAS